MSFIIKHKHNNLRVILLFILLYIPSLNLSAQSKKEQILTLTSHIDSLNQVVNMQTVEIQKKDSIITVYDIEGILKKCNIKIWRNKKLNIISLGRNIDLIKKNGIFSNIKDSTDFIIVYSNTYENVTYYRIFRPRTGADGHFGVMKINNKIIKLKTTYGWF